MNVLTHYYSDVIAPVVHWVGPGRFAALLFVVVVCAIDVALQAIAQEIK